MTLRELINTVLNKGHIGKCVKEIIHYYYPSDLHPQSDEYAKWVGKIDAKFQGVVRELLHLNSAVAEYDISVHSMTEESEEYIDVSLYSPINERKYALDFSDWRTLIDASIQNTPALTETALLAHILWEITFYGFTEKEVLKARNDLEKAK